MVFHMKTTLIIPDPLFRELKLRATRRGETLSNVVAEALRRGLAREAPAVRLPPLPRFKMGRARVDISDRDALYEAMEGR